jgi:hypothetical protein
MENYIENPSLDILAEVYNSINAMDFSWMPSLTRAQRLILRNTDTDGAGLFDQSWRECLDIPSSSPRSKHDVLEPGSHPIGDKLDLKPRANKDFRIYETHIEFMNIKVPVRIPMTFVSKSEEVADVRPSLLLLYTYFSNFF